jgi:hypothetical protein
MRKFKKEFKFEFEIHLNLVSTVANIVGTLQKHCINTVEVMHLLQYHQGCYNPPPLKKHRPKITKEEGSTQNKEWS